MLDSFAGLLKKAKGLKAKKKNGRLPPYRHFITVSPRTLHHRLTKG